MFHFILLLTKNAGVLQHAIECQFSLTPAKININVQVIWYLRERNSEIIADCERQRRSSLLMGAQVQFITVNPKLQ